MRGKFLQYGAGNIGRGFIGQLFSQSGYEVCFVDINNEIISLLNRHKKYPVNILSTEENKEIWVENVRGILGTETENVINEIAQTDYMAISVGVNVLPKIASVLSDGIKRRWENNNFTPLSILICENMIDADEYLHKLLYDTFSAKEQLMFNELIGLVETSIGRMVPIMTDKMRLGNPLRVCVESYCELPIDSESFVGKLPIVPQLKPYSPFSFYIRRKLFIHNLGHAITAYLGNLYNYEYIWQAIANPIIRKFAENAMCESGICLAKYYNIDFSEIKQHIDDLLNRFANRALGDTVFRVGRDIGRKLSEHDRFCGAISFCSEMGLKPIYIPLGIAAAMFFDDDSDGTKNFLSILASDGIEYVLSKICSLEPNEIELIQKYHTSLIHAEPLEEILRNTTQYLTENLQITI